MPYPFLCVAVHLKTCGLPAVSTRRALEARRATLSPASLMNEFVRDGHHWLSRQSRELNSSVTSRAVIALRVGARYEPSATRCKWGGVARVAANDRVDPQSKAGTELGKRGKINPAPVESSLGPAQYATFRIILSSEICHRLLVSPLRVIAGPTDWRRATRVSEIVQVSAITRRPHNWADWKSAGLSGYSVWCCCIPGETIWAMLGQELNGGRPSDRGTSLRRSDQPDTNHPDV